jgi:hypothetical protein
MATERRWGMRSVRTRRPLGSVVVRMSRRCGAEAERVEFSATGTETGIEVIVSWMLSGDQCACFFMEDAIIRIMPLQGEPQIALIFPAVRWVGDEVLNQILNLGITHTSSDRKEDYAVFNVLVIPEE